MVQKSSRSSRKELPRARILSHASEHALIACGVDAASLPYMRPKLTHKNLLIEGIKLYAANILKQSMLSIGGDVAVHRQVISGKAEHSNCVVMGDLRHYRLLITKLRSQPGLEDIAACIEEQVFQDRSTLTLCLCGRLYQWDRLPVIMGILNITPDSFSDGGLYLDAERALDHALAMVESGAEIIDIGGESSRPGANAVECADEIARVIPVIEKISAKVNVPVSIDTTKAAVARAAIDAGACLINDISALRGDPDMLEAAGKTGAGVVLMHMKGTPGTMQDDTHYRAIIDDTYAFLSARIQACLDAGIDPVSIVVDPGIGFGKDLQGNLQILNHIAEFSSLKVPVLLGHSRKSFIGSILDAPVDSRGAGTDAVSAWATIKGVDILRVHDVQHACDIRRVIRSVMESV